MKTLTSLMIIASFIAIEASAASIRIATYNINRGGGIREAMAALSTTEDKHAAEIDAIIAAIDCERPTVIVIRRDGSDHFLVVAELK
ncbi:hypothetical protein NHH03_10740 [Stieleria sp. TO1_6]|uniref:hypothetical protein n=1 Tax=Stieleria tagensis TaxID=2956795 RepID=UPI00209AA90C|nr:hypothetical protein [Stieleria tagensis]MCO8122216.1 hypothetical protein [Stieleria tagensis]